MELNLSALGVLIAILVVLKFLDLIKHVISFIVITLIVLLASFMLYEQLKKQNIEIDTQSIESAVETGIAQIENKLDDIQAKLQTETAQTSPFDIDSPHGRKNLEWLAEHQQNINIIEVNPDILHFTSKNLATELSSINNNGAVSITGKFFYKQQIDGTGTHTYFICMDDSLYATKFLNILDLRNGRNPLFTISGAFKKQGDCGEGYHVF